MSNSIYIIRNTITDKVYIGQTIRSLECRWNRHKRDSKTYNTHLYKAMRKYGIDKFSISIIYLVLSQHHLNEAEIYFIKEYNSYKTGYNETLGGSGGSPMLGKSHTGSTKNKMSLSHRNRHRGYIIHTPWGKFTSYNQASKTCYTKISDVTLKSYCGYHKYVSEYLANRPNILSPDMINKTFKEIGFWTEYD